MLEIPDICSAVFVCIATDQHLSGSISVPSPASHRVVENLTALISTRFLQFLNVPTDTFSRSIFCVHVLSPLCEIPSLRSFHYFVLRIIDDLCFSVPNLI